MQNMVFLGVFDDYKGDTRVNVCMCEFVCVCWIVLLSQKPVFRRAED
jgi:hypothetical protein